MADPPGVREDLRRQGIGKFLLAQLLRRIQDQYYEIVEAHAVEEDVPTRGLLRALGFEQVDTGQLYQR